MLRHLLPAAALSITLALPAGAQTETWDYTGFDTIDASAGIQVEFKTAADYSVSADIQGGERSDLRVRLRGDTLELSRKSKWNRSGHVKVTFLVTAPSLKKVETSSGVSMTALGIDSETFEIESSSGSSLNVAGRCGDLEIDASSGTSVDALDLQCVDAEIDASSGSSVRAYASGEIRVEGSSGASVRVAGGGESVDVDTSGGSSIRIEPREL